jgi:hypothetical protein
MTERVPRLPDPERQDTSARRGEHQARLAGQAAMGQSGDAEHTRAGSLSGNREGDPSEREHVYDQITNRIIRALEAGTVPWQKPWGASGGWPRSMSTGKRYQGVNVLMLGMTSEERGYGSPWWGHLPPGRGARRSCAPRTERQERRRPDDRTVRRGAGNATTMRPTRRPAIQRGGSSSWHGRFASSTPHSAKTCPNGSTPSQEPQR